MRISVYCITCWLSMLFSVVTQAAEPPNIVVILTDDQGYSDLSFDPEHKLEVFTPNMDFLASEGVFFTQAYTSGAVCSPTRAGLMLGQYQQRVGVYTAGDGGRGFDPTIPIFPSFLPSSFRSTAIGKWHLGLDQDYPELKWHALNRGFDECYKFMGRGGHDYFQLKGVKGDTYEPIYRNKTRLKNEDYSGYLTTRLSEEAVKFIKKSRSQPFFLYLAYNAVHAPAQAPKENIERIQERYPKLTKKRATLMAMLQHLDSGIGDVLKALRRTGKWNNTLLFFLTDNGGAKAMEADNGSLRGYKGSLFEGGIRTPWVVTWPDRFSGRRQLDTPVISLDILPTVLDAIGAPAQTTANMDGKSLLPLLTGSSHTVHDRLFWDSGDDKQEWAVREGPWKLHQLKREKILTNLESDPGEKKNLLSDFPDKARDLETAYRNWRASVEASAKEYGSTKRERRRQR